MRKKKKTKNTKSMFYALYRGLKEIVDDDGDLELETTSTYYNPVSFDASLSSGQSDAEYSPFGKDVSYDRIVTSFDMNLPIDENSLIWYRNKPSYYNDGTVNPNSADYEVTAPPLDGLGVIRIAIRKRFKTVKGNLSNNNITSKSGNNSIASNDSTEDDGF